MKISGEFFYGGGINEYKGYGMAAEYDVAKYTAGRGRGGGESATVI